MFEKKREPKHFIYVAITIVFTIAAIYAFYNSVFDYYWKWVIPISLAMIALFFSFLANKK